MYVIKASGKKEEFNSEKVYNTVLRAGASKKLADEIMKEVESKVHEGIRTKEILDIALGILRRKSPDVSMVYNLKKAIMNLGPTGFVFERFFAEVLRNYGYKTQVGEILRGKFATHEVDIIASNKSRYMIECKYHNSPGTHTDLKVALYVYARFLDLKKDFDYPWLVTNTKCTDRAVGYAEGVKMKVTSWQYPKNESLQELIEKKNLYPITLLKSVNNFIKWRFSEIGFLFVKDLIEHDFQELKEKTKIPDSILRNLVEEAKQVSRVKTKT